MNSLKFCYLTFSFFLVFSVNASVGIKPNYITGNLELKKISNNTIQLETNLVSFNKETFEVERSYDNKVFQTIAVVFAFEPDACFPPLQMKDRINKTGKKVYYRIKKINGDRATYIQNKSIQL